MGDDDIVEVMASPRADNGGTENEEPRTTAVSVSRRSKRDSAVKPELVAATAQEESATATQQRRSQRSVKSTYATTATATKELSSKRESVGKKTLKTDAVQDVAGEAEKSSEPPRRTRSARGATSVVAPPSETALPPASPVKAEPSVANEGASSEGVAPPPPTPPRNRRPSRRQVDVDSSTTGSKQQQNQHQQQHQLSSTAHLILDTFSASDATALCEVVWYQIKENSYKADVLLKDKSPATIDWSRVSQRLARSHDVALAPLDCQRLWKFLSYGIDTVKNTERSGEEEEEEEEEPLLADSDPEDYELTTAQINARVKSARDANDNTQEATSVDAVPAELPSQELHAAGTRSDSLPVPAVATHQQQTAQRETLRTTGVQLFPVYDQPRGVPDDWRNPSGLGTNMPLVFVAEKFLKRKPITGFTATTPATTTAATTGPVIPATGTATATASTPTATATATVTATATAVDASVLAAAAASVVLSGEKLQSKYKRKRKSDIGIGDGGDAGDATAGGSEKKPRKKKAPSVAKTPLAASGSAAKAKSPGPVATPTATTSSGSGGRQSYVPSTTPPPLPTPARSAFAFFCHLYQQNPTIAATSSAVDPHTSTATSAATVPLDRVFAGAPLSVRAACDQMAVDDQRRFDREQLRRRLWEKAVASLHSSPAPSPLPLPVGSAPGPPAPMPVAAASRSTTTITSSTAAAAAVVGLVTPTNDAVGTTSQILDLEPLAS